MAPNDADALIEHARFLLQHFRPEEAESLLTRLLAAHPGRADAWALQGLVQQMHGQIPVAVRLLRHAVKLSSSPVHHSQLLAALQYDSQASAESLLAEHRQWDEAHARALATPCRPRSRGSRPLRLGFVSADFGVHPVACLLLGVLQNLDRAGCDVTCYSDRPRDDEDTPAFRATADRWRDTAGQSDAELAELIRADEIDILFDLSGHAGQRLLAFARRPAPLQVSWLGYVGTTGLAAMDCLLADRFHVPLGEEHAYVEEVLRLPDSYATYSAPRDALAVSPLPAANTPHVTLGCFNNPAKYSSPALDAWAAILQRVPDARLLLKYGWLSEPAAQQALRGRFERRAIGGERILIEGAANRAEMLAAYHRVDLALDSQPYSGGVTTCEALWMGVPVITVKGRTFAGRHSTSYLTTAGLAEFIAADWPSYVELAVQWIQRLPELAALRAALRDRVQRSPLGQHAPFARYLFAVLRETWDRRCGGA